MLVIISAIAICLLVLIVWPSVRLVAKSTRALGGLEKGFEDYHRGFDKAYRSVHPNRAVPYVTPEVPTPNQSYFDKGYADGLKRASAEKIPK